MQIGLLFGKRVLNSCAFNFVYLFSRRFYVSPHFTWSPIEFAELSPGGGRATVLTQKLSLPFLIASSTHSSPACTLWEEEEEEENPMIRKQSAISLCNTFSGINQKEKEKMEKILLELGQQTDRQTDRPILWT